MTYFDNGEGYGDDDDGDEEGPVYWRGWRTSLLKSLKDQSTEEHEGPVYWTNSCFTAIDWGNISEIVIFP